MPGKIQFRPDRQSGPLLASTIIMFLGAIAAATVTTASGQNPLMGLLIFVGLAAVIPVFLLLVHTTPQKIISSLIFWAKGRKAPPKTNYQPRAVQATRRYGTNRPPSATELKEMKGGTNNWVPANAPTSRRSTEPGESGSSKPR